jgi:hypothetical protein
MDLALMLKDEDYIVIFINIVELKEEIYLLIFGMEAIRRHLSIDIGDPNSRAKEEAPIPITSNNEEPQPPPAPS